MNQEQLKRAHILRSYNEGLLSRKDAAGRLNISQRQITRLAKAITEKGEAALIHKNTGRQPATTISETKRSEILELRRESAYADCNINHFLELLESRHDILVSYSTLYNILKEGGIESPKKHGRTNPHRRRKRKSHAGELLQIDASPYDWLGTGEELSLHGCIDDATGQVTGLYMQKNECLQGYIEVMRQTCTNFGVPLSVYSDKHTIFRSPLTGKKEELGEEANLTQFGRMLAELGTDIIHAHSPQAKGRIERLWGTLQSRLPVEFRLSNISTIEEANAFLSENYTNMYNERFSVAAEKHSIFVPLRTIDDIDNILCVKEIRKTDSAGVISFKGKSFKVLDKGYPLIPARSQVEVLLSLRRGVRVRYKDRVYETELFEKTVSKPTLDASKSTTKKPKSATKPKLIHSSDEWKKYWHAETYSETLDLLYSIFFKPVA